MDDGLWCIEIWKMKDCSWAKIHKRGTHPNKKRWSSGDVRYLIRPGLKRFKKFFRQKKTWLMICYDAKANTLENCDIVSRDYQQCHFTTHGLLSLQKNIALYVSTWVVLMSNNYLEELIISN